MGGGATAADPWSPQPPVRTAASANDPWSPATGGADVDDFDLLTSRAKQTASPIGRTGSPFDMSGLDGALSQTNGGAKPKKSPESFLGPNSNLVNLENLVKSDNVIIRPACFSSYFSFSLVWSSG